MLLSLLGHFTYLAIFAFLTGAGLGLPFPEELTQLAAGFLSRQGILSFWPALATTYCGILFGDYLLFRIGRSHGVKLMSSRWFRRFFTPRRRAFLERHFSRHDFWTIFAARHASGFRVPVFATAGAMGVTSRTFLLADGASALLSVPLVVSLGYLFASKYDLIRRELHDVRIGLAIAIPLAVLLFVLVRRWLRQRASRAQAAGAPAPERIGVDPASDRRQALAPPAARR